MTKQIFTFNRVTKAVENHLKELAAALPEVPVSKKETIKGSELLKGASPEDLKGWLANVELDKTYTVRRNGALQAVNHFKKLKSVYMNEAWEGVAKYLEPYKNKSSIVQPEVEEQASA